MGKITSGLQGIDRALHGLEENQVFLLSGGTGTGKTALSLTFLSEGLKRGEGAIMVASDFPEDILSFCQEFLGVDLRGYIQADRLILLEYPTTVEEFKNPALAFGVEDIFAELYKLRDELHPSRVVIDSLSPWLTFSAGRDPSDFARSLVLGFRGLSATVLLTGDVEGEASFREVYNALERLVYGVFELKMEPGPNILARSMYIKKMKEAPERSTFHFLFRPGEGAVFIERPAEPAPAAPAPPPVEVATQVPHFAEALSRELSRATRYNRPLSLAVLSLEEFKLRRLTNGKDQEILNLLHRFLLSTCRETDIISRYSFDRFLALLPETTAPNAARFIHRASENFQQRLVEQAIFPPGEVPPLKYSISEHPGDTSQGEDLLAAALRRLK